MGAGIAAATHMRVVAAAMPATGGLVEVDTAWTQQGFLLGSAEGHSS